jgi:outer membrane receptor for ferrienterochelin and colicins
VHFSIQMRSILLIIAFVTSLQIAFAQHTLRLKVIDDEHIGLPAVGVSVGDSLQAATDTAGYITFTNLAAGSYDVKLSSLGFFKKKIPVTIPNAKLIEVQLQPASEELQEVVVVTTRSAQSVDVLPTRVEVITQEEVEERATDKPSDISHAVKEQPGIQLQRTSASSGTFNIRLQGLKGKYVQVLKDGFPVFGGLSQNLSIAQIPPLDLRQIEIIKGPSSTLYGGDAIAGVINLISKEPVADKPEYTLMVNGETALAGDLGFYASQKIKKMGFSFISQYRHQEAVDWNDDKFSDVPKVDRWSFAPQIYLDLNQKIKLIVGANYAGENRLGGAMAAINQKTDSVYDYLETNKSSRLGTTIRLEYGLGDKGRVAFRSSVNSFHRALSIYTYQFGGNQLSTASEINYHLHVKQHDIVAGLDFKSDRFNETHYTAINNPDRSYQFYTGGLFLQDLYKPSLYAGIEAGLRVDYNQRYGLFALPHAAWMQQWSEVFRTKVNFGMGYKLPTVFQDESEEDNFRHVSVLPTTLKPELSLGGTVDVTVKIPITPGLKLEVSEMVFYTRIIRPLIAQSNNGFIQFTNASGYIQGAGLETSVRASYRGVNLFATYTVQDQLRKLDSTNKTSPSPLTSKHIFSMLVSYEYHNKFAIGLDFYYWSPQVLSNGNPTSQIWEMGMNVQGRIKWVVLFGNLENILNIRQTNRALNSVIVTPDPTYHNPKFSEVYAPLEGRILNIGAKFYFGELIKKKPIVKDKD